jgi:hypothetical protein
VGIAKTRKNTPYIPAKFAFSAHTKKKKKRTEKRYIHSGIDRESVVKT